MYIHTKIYEQSNNLSIEIECEDEDIDKCLYAHDATLHTMIQKRLELVNIEHAINTSEEGDCSLKGLILPINSHIAPFVQDAMFR